MFFFFNDTATTEIYTLSLHDALPICFGELGQRRPRAGGGYVYLRETWGALPAFLYGWALLLVIATGAIAAVAVTFANYTLALAGLSPRLTVPLAIGAIALLSGINYPGGRPAAVTQNVFTILKLAALRSEEHTSELQSPCNLVCRLLL